MHLPPTDETIALVLDDDHRGHTIVVVDGTSDPDSVLDVVERLVDSIVASGRDGSLVVASIRPGRGPLEGDGDRWLEASDLAEAAGVELLEWFVVDGAPGRGHGVVPAGPARRAAAVAAVSQPVRARRWAGVRRRPAARSRRTSSRLSTSVAPKTTASGRSSSGMS